MENFDHIPEEIQLLISDFFKETIDEQGLRLLNEWISGNDEHLHLFYSYKSIWLLSGNTTPVSPEKTEEALFDIKQKLNHTSIKKQAPFWTIRKIAASWLLFLITGGAMSFLLTKYISGNNNQKEIITSITAPLGSKSVIDLPDGTKVWLNAGSKLAYNSEYGRSTREVRLTGEAYFSVKTNKKVPFLVKTSDVLVKALGTKFNVKAYPEEKTITATLEEGKIVLTPLSKSSSAGNIELKPKEMATFYKHKVEISPLKAKKEITQEKIVQKVGKTEGTLNVDSDVKTDLVTSWKDSTWIIESQPLGILAPVLERRYNMIITFDSNKIRKYKFTGKIQKETIEQIMSALELSAPIQYKIERDTVTISLNRVRQKQYDQYTNN